MKKNTIVIGAQVNTYENLNTINSQGYIDAYSTTQLEEGHKLVIASLSQRGMVINSVVTKISLVPHVSQYRKFRIYFTSGEISLGLPTQTRFNQNFTYIRVGTSAVA